MHPELPLEQLLDRCERAMRQRFERAGIPPSQRDPDQIRAKPVEGKPDRYEDTRWVGIGNLRDALVRKYLVVWWNERIDGVRCVETPVWPRMASHA